MGFDENFIWQMLIVVGGVTLFAILLILFLYLYLKKKKKDKNPQSTVVVDNEKWVNALGGSNNILSIEAKGSRLVVGIADNGLVDKERLHELGVSSIIVSQDKVTLVTKEKAENIKNLLQ